MSVEFQNKLVAVLNKSIERTLQTKEENLIYYGIVLFGDWTKATELTKKCSLWR
ncbi:DUF2000 family protein [Legionella drancourtii]|uniref:Uncharacterized protein n=1 Tax=Legionella drancourtii LLAP12 TaxID=658187 RepID=G9EPQ4_9GAMM|nr:DUF2000 family protein [Legionella drancourtii]EHL30756.1 hypothetical protein LDG_7242 [Legionella drancourtii LLAP12]